MTLRRWSLLPIALAGAIVGLAGCASADAEFAVLDSEAGPEDILPSAFEEPRESATVDDETIRFVGENGDTSLWIARSTESDSGMCLLVHPGGGDAFIGCGDATGVTVSDGEETYALVADGASAPGDSTQISENVYALG